MRPNILTSLIDIITTHVGLTDSLGELIEMRQDAERTREAIKPSSFESVQRKREAKVAMLDALISLIDAQINSEHVGGTA